MPQYDPMGIMGQQQQPQQPGLDPQMLMQALSGGQVAEPGMPGSPLAGPPEGVSPTFAPSGKMGKGEALMMALAATVADSGGGTIGQQAFSQLTSARKKAAFTDTLKARNSLKRAIDKAAKDGTEIDVSAPLHLLNDRINNVNRLKGDPADTMAARQLLTSDPLAAYGAVNDELESMEAQGLGKLPKSFYGEKQEHTTMLQNIISSLPVDQRTPENIQKRMAIKQGFGAGSTLDTELKQAQLDKLRAETGKSQADVSRDIRRLKFDQKKFDKQASLDLKKLDQTAKTADRNAPLYKANISRMNDLNITENERVNRLPVTKELLANIQSEAQQTGTTRWAADFLPGVWSTQGEMDQFFQAYAEELALAKAKEGGGVVTEADLENALNQVPTSDKDEAVNIKLLQNMVRREEGQQREHAGLREAFEGGTLGSYTKGYIPGEIPTITTKAAYDALPSGAMYMEDGQQYRKP